MPKNGLRSDDYDVPKNWTTERKWQRVRELLIGAESVEVIDNGSSYTYRVWTKVG